MANRRIVLAKFVSVFTAIATLGVSIPFIRSLFPARKPEHYLDVDISSIRPGLSLKLNWQGRPVIIIARSDEHLTELTDINREDLLDPDSISSSQPEFAINHHRSRRPDYFLAYANCTHLGCEVVIDEKGNFECPCHQSTYDSAGRVRRGGAAKRNLDIPNYRFTTSEIVRLTNEKS